LYAFSVRYFAKKWSFPFLWILDILSENSIIYLRGADKMKGQTLEKQECVYCSGKGYFQLLLGGSETCSCCGGSGKKKE
jgi:hypothetical protein